MASTYSDLKIELIGTGEQTGTWGTTTNDNFSIAIGEAITGSADVAFSSADVTVTLTNTNASQAARNLRLNLTGTSGGARNLILGSGCQIEKLYLINNGLADAVTVANTTGTGITVPAGKSMFVYNNGTNVVEAINSLVTLDVTTLDATNIEVTNIKAKDGTASATIANSTGVMTVGSSVLTTTDINGGTIDGTTIGASTPSTVVATQVNITGQGDLRLEDTTGGEYVALQAPSSLAGSYTLTMPVDDGTNGQALITDGNGVLSWSTAASGDVYGPASATDNAIARFDLTTGKIIQNSVVIIADTTGDMTGVGTLSSGAITTTGVLTLPAGTVSAPAITTTGDTNTGIFFPAADTIAFTEGGVESMRITSAGRLGIGTNNPTATLEVLGGGSDGFQPFAVNSTSAELYTTYRYSSSTLLGYIGNGSGTISGASNLFVMRSQNDLAFAAGGATERMRIDSSGNVGIGTSSPSASLTVFKQTTILSGTGNGYGMYIYPTGTGATYIDALNNSTSNSSISLRTYNNGTYTQAIHNNAGNTTTFETAGSERMRIASDGKVGIGTSNPLFDLQVQNSSSTISLGGTPTTNGTGRLKFINSNFVVNWQISTNDSTAGALEFMPSTATGGSTFTTPAMLIAATGNVGIGTSSPSTRLHVVATGGAIRMQDNGGVAKYIQMRSDSTNSYLEHIGGTGDALRINNQTAGTLEFYTSNTERMRITSGGDVLIGTTTNTGSRKVNVVGNIAATNTDAVDNQLVIGADANVAFVAATYGSTGAYKPLTFNTNGSERVRISTEGFLKASNTGSYLNSTGTYHELVSSTNGNNSVYLISTSATDPYGPILYFTGTTPNNTTNYFLVGEDPTNRKFIIYSNGTISNRTGTYNAISDIKLKQDIVDAGSQWDDIKNLRVRKFRLKDEVAANPNYPAFIGLVAQEAALVSPGLVDDCPDFEEIEAKDEEGNITKSRKPTGTVTKSVKYSILYMKAVKALQEAMERIETLEAKVTALENK